MMMMKSKATETESWSDIIAGIDIHFPTVNEQLITDMRNVVYSCNKVREACGCEQCKVKEYCDKFFKIKPYEWGGKHEH